MIFHRGLPFEDEISVTDSQDDFITIDYADIYNEKYQHCTQASHCLFYYRTNFPILKVYNPRALVLMQVRFDGHLGFPGGVANPGESPEDALMRELSEEMDIPSSIHFDIDDRRFIHYNEAKSLILHFYTKEVPAGKFRELELRSAQSSEFGHEVLGVLRVPLYTMVDGYRGFPAFLRNQFIGNARQQLLLSLKELNIMSEEEINKALAAHSIRSLMNLKTKVFDIKDEESVEFKQLVTEKP